MITKAKPFQFERLDEHSYYHEKDVLVERECYEKVIKEQEMRIDRLKEILIDRNTDKIFEHDLEEALEDWATDIKRENEKLKLARKKLASELERIADCVKGSGLAIRIREMAKELRK